MTTTIPNVGGDLDARITSVPDAENASLREFHVAIALYRRNDRTCVCVYVYIHVHIHIYTYTHDICIHVNATRSSFRVPFYPVHWQNPVRNNVF